MVKEKRKRTDTVDGQIETLKLAAIPLLPPKHIKLREDEKPFWDSIIKARARDSWNDVDLENAANLAFLKANVEKMRHEVAVEGNTLELANGKIITHPNHNLIKEMTARIVTLSRLLQIHAEATQGRGRDTGQRTKKQQKLIDNASGGGDNFATPPERVQ